mmetsp:Transcript_91926/g.291594  ORF Transcript_91926/g.291594 Transcript_91926/m.291594 type:complete len:335 (+) Transcript_91926:71-1075(+)
MPAGLHFPWLYAAIVWRWAPALAADAAGGQCAADGHCPLQPTMDAAEESMLMQMSASRGERALSGQQSDAAAPKELLQPSGVEVDLNISEALLQAGGMRPATSSERNAFLSLHNLYRCMHGAPHVVWDSAVAASANSWASGLRSLTHSSSYSLPPPAGPAGENLYWSSGFSTPSQVVGLWYDEVQNCRGGPTGFTDGCHSSANGKATGHFTAMVWKGVKSIGCAWSNDNRIALCRYKADDFLNSNTPNMQPQSNYVAQVPRQVRTRAQCGGQSVTAPVSAPAPPPFVCRDSLTYRDPWWGDSCAGWTGYPCLFWPFASSLRSNCPKACGLCHTR